MGLGGEEESKRGGGNARRRAQKGATGRGAAEGEGTTKTFFFLDSNSLSFQVQKFLQNAPHKLSYP